MNPLSHGKLDDHQTSICSEDEGFFLPQTDGPIDLETGSRRKRVSGDVCAIFVHAGAGYHSVQNEKIHLSACEEYVA